jgi:hypothetical protein
VSLENVFFMQFLAWKIAPPMTKILATGLDVTTFILKLAQENGVCLPDYIILSNKECRKFATKGAIRDTSETIQHKNRHKQWKNKEPIGR